MFKINKKHLIIFFLVFFIFVHNASANVEITKVNNDPPVRTDHLWIKVHNDSSDEIDLTAWSVADRDSDGKWHFHAIKAYSSNILSPNSYAVIAKASSTTIDIFRSKNSDITEQLFYGNFTIEDEGTIALSQDGKTIINQINYGRDNNLSQDNSTDASGGSDSISISSSNSINNESLKIYKPTTKIIAPKIIMAGMTLIVSHQTTGVKNEKVILGKFVWNLGDGMTRALRISDPFQYIYKYPGDYVVTLSFYDSILGSIPDATDMITIKVVPSNINISSVGTQNDPYVEIENNSSYEIIMFNFVLRGSTHSFKIPGGMIILPNKKLKLSPQITGFNFNDLKSLSLTDDSGQVFATYPNKVVPTYKNSTPNIDNIVKSSAEEASSLDDVSEVINLNNIGANVLDDNQTFNSRTYAWFGLVGIIIVGFISIILIKRNENYPDYIEGELSAKDMTIIE